MSLKIVQVKRSFKSGLIQFLSVFVRTPRERIDEPKKVLVITLTHIGDCVLASPFLSACRQRYPSVDVVVKRGLAELFADDGASGHISEFSCPWVGAASWPLGFFSWLRLLWRLRSARYDLAVVSHSHPFSSLTARLVARYCVGIGEPGDRLLDLRLDQSAIAGHVSERFDALADVLQLGRLSYPSLNDLGLDGHRSATVFERIEAWNKSLPDQGTVVICIHPGAGGVQKRWPAANFASAMNCLADRHSVAFILVAGAAEESVARDLLSKVRETVRVLDLTSELDLAGLVGVFQASDMYWGNDSGPTHLAAACATRTYVMFGPASSAAAWSPKGAGVKVRELPAPSFYGAESVEIVAHDISEGIERILKSQLSIRLGNRVITDKVCG